MHKLMRSIARANMKAAGVGSMNRKHLFKDKDGNERKASFFSIYWRDWVNGNPHAKKKRGRKSKKV